MIRSADLRPGDVLIDHFGDRYRLTRRHTYRRWDAERLNGFDIWIPWGFIPDADIDRSGPDRLWWLDDAVWPR